ncbi:N-succinylarginine dihydrolase [Shewanella sp. 202IG2-18]|uniref:N-succinylarginine dihydrolase n=1 Tax=Parashewanella hymeniacidonis TaxID=2807618 RepID=UPI00195F2EA7|nr:N-succinylarginine dihydrolase [Parashewanella hymeniacidonis]MBM7074393.1 N-succinylarginine dihydrolase [Parashewanella hymeniacidonis]
MKYIEANFDGLVGPTHNYSGLSFGNVASQSSAKQVSNPKSAALQGLKKAKALADMGLTQGILAPQMRPDVYSLRQLGFLGSDSQVLEKAFKQAPTVFNACCSASSMWAANAATVSPSPDTADEKVHFTAANLTDKLHRSIEHPTTSKILKAIFPDERYFSHHSALPSHLVFGDEGAANHTRLCNSYGDKGLELFTYGEHVSSSTSERPKNYPARQKLAASQAVARLHQLNPDFTAFIQQNPKVIDQGVFHNDVIAVGNLNTLFYHQDAFINQSTVFESINTRLNENLELIEVPSSKVSVKDAVSSYLFNTQLIELSNGKMALIAPLECQENNRVYAYLSELTTLDTSIRDVNYFDVKQSMQNGGGPACLRLRVVLSESELVAVNPSTLLNNHLYIELESWINQHYRDQLEIKDMTDVAFLNEIRTALDELTQILALGSIYSFQ